LLSVIKSKYLNKKGKFRSDHSLLLTTGSDEQQRLLLQILNNFTWVAIGKKFIAY